MDFLTSRTDLFGHSIPTFLIVKLVGLAVLAFVVNFIYTLKTGRSLTDDRNRALQQEHRAGGAESSPQLPAAQIGAPAGSKPEQ